jgi:large subunit ribosomal protein L3
MNGLIGKKLGMTQVYDADGRRVAVTVVQAGPCVVVQRKTVEQDGYDAVQVGFGEQKASRMPKAQTARFEKVEAAPHRVVREFSIEAGSEVKPGDTLTANDVFEGVQYVDVSGMTKGRGFQGVVKRYNFGGGRMTHGGHCKRKPGSIGQCSYPARVAKGQRLPGHMGNARVTQQNLKVVDVRAEDNVLLIKGSIPGPNGGMVLVRKALKKA